MDMPSYASRRPLAFVLAAMGLLGAGCTPLDSAKQEVEKQTMGSIANKAVDSVTGGRVGVSSTQGQVTFTDKGTGTSYTVGEHIIIPADFPKEMSVYPNAKILALSSGSQPSLNLQADETPDKVAIWYADALEADGWKESSRFAAGGYEGRSYAKGNVTVSLTYLGSRDNGSKSTVVHISRTQAK